MKRLLFSGPGPFWPQIGKVGKRWFWSDKMDPPDGPGAEPSEPRKCSFAEASGALRKRRVATTALTPKKHLLKREAGTIFQKGRKTTLWSPAC